MKISNNQAIYTMPNTMQISSKQDAVAAKSFAIETETQQDLHANTGLDMRNISQQDLKTLAKVTGDDRIWQYIPFEAFEFNGDTLVGVENKDYLGALERRIEYNRITGQTTQGYEATLAALKSYQGYILPKNIKTTA
ncbi:hypothetical protein ACFOEE_09065 [Pseudoalteromonas fenneropenaei]|uniref:Uncharacterized protein n=1 Tax=Pseudoalteromonas fenneropenaei TaxID=1737459 RepID=A0ABV7CJ63_9GAMM